MRIKHLMSLFLSSLILSGVFFSSASAEDELDKYKRQMIELERKMEEAKARKKKTIEVERRLARLNDKYIQAEDILTASERTVEGLKKEKQKITSELKKVKQQHGPVRDALTDMVDERAQLRKLIEQKQAQLDSLDSRITAQKQKIARFKEVKATSSKRLSFIDSELAKGKTKVQEAELAVIAIEKEQNSEKSKLKALRREMDQ